jgi:hypothetical protein
MPHKLHYDRGDRVGPGNAIYLEEVPSVDRYRAALFQCGYCENIFTSNISSVKHGNKKSCGCKNKYIRNNSVLTTHGLSQTKFYGRWVALVKKGACKEWRDSIETCYKWAIDNGYTEGSAIIRNDWSKEFSPENCRIGLNGEQSITHGESKTSLYKFWWNLKQHCRENEILLDPTWKSNFENFRDWAIANNYTPGMTLERLDRTKGFTPDNSYFQSFSKSQRECWIHGERMTFAEAGRRLGKSREMIRVYSTGKIKNIPEGLEFTPPNDHRQSIDKQK